MSSFQQKAETYTTMKQESVTHKLGEEILGNKTVFRGQMLDLEDKSAVINISKRIG